MATNKIRPFASGSGANVETDEQYAADLAAGGSLASGFRAGLAQSVQVNKVLRQSSAISAAVAQIIVDRSGKDVSDATATADLAKAIVAALYTNAALTGSPTAPAPDDKDATARIANTAWTLNALVSGWGLGSSLNVPGYIALPGLVTLQWGRGVSASSPAAGYTTVTLPTKFKSACFGAMVVEGNASGAWAPASGQTYGRITAHGVSSVATDVLVFLSEQSDGTNFAPAGGLGFYWFAWGV